MLKKLDTLTATIVRLEQRIEDLEDLRDLETAIAENVGKPLVSWEAARKQLEAD